MGGKEFGLHKRRKKNKTNTVLYKVEALSKQRAHTIKGNAHTPTQHKHTHTCRQSLFFFCFFSFFILNGDEDTGSLQLQVLQPESMLNSSMPCGLQWRPTPELKTSDQT